ncbi:MAG: hypothetical protein ACI9QV_000486, partial [Methylophagaceae bacterium]
HSWSKKTLDHYEKSLQAIQHNAGSSQFKK